MAAPRQSSQIPAIFALHRNRGDAANTATIPGGDVGAAPGLFTHAYCAFGHLARATPDYEHAELPDRRDIFDLASLTKALVTTPLVFHQLELSALTVDATIGKWLGTKADALAPVLRQLSVRSLLAHSSGLPAWRNFWVCHLGIEPQSQLQDSRFVHRRLIEGLNRIAGANLSVAPDQLYSDVGFLLLGLALELASGLPLPAQFDGFCRDTLGLENKTLPLAYAPSLDPELLRTRAVPTAYCALRGHLLCGEVHDENCASLGGATGHAGVFGSGPALARYLHVLATSSVGKRLLAANAAARHLPPGVPPNEGLLGWRQGADPSSAVFAGAGSAPGSAIGHMGFTGVAFWVCPETQVYAMLLTNRVSGGRTRPGIAAMRRDVFTALAAMGNPSA